MTKAELLAKLEALEPKMPEMHCRIAPSSFDPNDNSLRAYPRPFSWRWSACEKILRAFRSQGVMMHLPLFWQLESPLFNVCREIGASFFVAQVDNLPLSRAAIERADIDTVVTGALEADIFSKYLFEKHAIFPNSWLIVHSVESQWDIASVSAAPGNLAQEIHLFPGVPLLEQCFTLVQKRTNVFHPSESFSFKHEDGSTYVSDIEEPYYTRDFLLPCTLESAESCSCGKETFRRKV